MTAKTRKGLRWFDWVLLVLLAVVCNLVFQETDIFHTGGASFAYLKGHILDFYSYTRQAIGGTSYMPTTYVLYAIWNLPLYLLGLKNTVDMEHTLPVQLWYTILPILCFVGIAVVVYKLAILKGFSDRKGKIAAYAFAASPVAFYSQFIFTQYDSITLLFVMLGVYYYFKDDRFKFVLFFAIAVTCKYFALLIFVPMVLLREKKVWPIIAHGVGVMALFLLEILVYLRDPAMRSSVFGFGATGYIFNVVLDTGDVFPKISVVILAWVSICAWAFFTKPEEGNALWKWFLYFEGLVLFCVFGLSMWHPQWLLLAIPFMVFSTMMHKRADIFWLLDLVLMLCYVWFSILTWPDHLDQCLLRNGVLAGLIDGRAQAGRAMQDFFPIHTRSLPFSALSALMLVNALFKHPKWMIDSPQTETPDHVGLLRLRFLGGIAMYIVPCMICFYSMMQAPYPFSGRVMAAYDLTWITPLQQGAETFVLEQPFSAKRGTVEQLDVKFENEEPQQGDVIISIVDATDNVTLREMAIVRGTIVSREKTRFRFEPLTLNPEHQYKIVMLCREGGSGTLSVYYTPGASEEGPASVNGEAKDFCLAADLFGR